MLSITLSHRHRITRLEKIAVYAEKLLLRSRWTGIAKQITIPPPVADSKTPF
jgi:hypothetical protein